MGRRGALAAALAAVLVSGAWPRAWAAPAPRPSPISFSTLDTPYHGDLGGLAFGGHGELRFAEDRVAGVSNPDWFSVGRVNGFVFAHLRSGFDAAGQACWDRGSNDFVLERAEVGVRFRRSMQAHAGIFLVPIGSTNLAHDAPGYDFAERSLVATQLVGVPDAQVGIGLRGVRLHGKERASRLSWEADLITGYDDGLITESPGGTRIPSGRNNYGDKNGIPALAWRLSNRSPSGRELGISMVSGPYNRTEQNGVRVDDMRWVHVIVADGSGSAGGFRLFSEASYAMIDVPPGLRALFAERQWGASVEVVRTLFDPLFHGWQSAYLTAGLRADAVDFDRSIQGDSRSRLSASLNLHSRPLAVTRLGWYYEIRRDRFNNATPLAGVTFTAATYF